MALYVDIEKKCGDFLLKVKFTAEKEVLGLLGASGCGKSMTLKCIAGIEKPDKGVIRLDDKVFFDSEKRIHLPVQKRRVGYLFQDYALFPNMTVLQNVMEGLVTPRKVPKKLAEQVATSVLEKVGMADKAGMYPIQLSGGQQQRVGIARAMALSPELLLFDEPTSALDPELVGDVLNVMRQLADTGQTMIIVTHEMQFAQEVADKVVFMADGVVVEAGTPTEVFDNPKQERTKQFLMQVRFKTAV